MDRADGWTHPRSDHLIKLIKQPAGGLNLLPRNG